MLEVVNSTYVGMCYRGKKAGAFMIHQFWKRPSGGIFAVVQCLQSKKLKSVSKMSIFRAINDKRLMFGYTWFLCKRCKGSGKNRFGNVCPRCDGIATIWIDVGYSCDAINVRRPYVHKKDTDRITVSQMLEYPSDTPKPIESSD